MDEERIKSYLKSQLSLLNEKIELIDNISWNGNVEAPTIITEFTGYIRALIEKADEALVNIQQHTNNTSVVVTEEKR